MSGVVTFGETLGLISTGHLGHATTATIGIGGAESNVAIGLRRLGVAATWVGRVGNDGWGDRVVRELRAEDVSLHVVVDPDAATAVMTKERRTSQATLVIYHRRDSAGSRLTPEDVPATLIAEAEVLHLTGIMPGLSSTTLLATRRAVAVATSAGVAISFDVNHRMGVWGERAAGEVYREIAAASAVVFAGEDEARLLTCTDTEDPRRLLGELSALSAGDAVLKRGEHGCWALIGGVEYQCAAVPVPVTDTVGAGDAFVAGYLTELVSGSAPDVRLRTAVQCGAFVCMSPGDWEGLPTRADLAAVHSSQPVRR